MKKVLLVFAIIPFAFFYHSCTKDKTPVPNCVQSDTVNTYTKSVKVIMDNNCALGGCHDALTAYNGVRLDTYENTLAAAQNDTKFFCSIDHSCTPYMPYLLPKMADSLIAKMNAWKSNCYAP